MLTHGSSTPANPARVVILGAGGFVSGAAQRRLEKLGVPVLALSRTNLDLRDANAGERLGAQLRADDAVLFVAAKAPVKNTAMLLDNIAMGKSVCDALSARPVAHVVYVSSDAVYADSDAPLTEQSCAQPASLHGVMHLAREVMLANTVSGPLCLLRPTLIFGDDDPHNGYGPNRFQRLAKNGEAISLFGDGEERRDHVWVEDVAEIIVRALRYRSTGTLNVATGGVTSFREIAERVVARSGQSSITTAPRSGPMPHNGHRPFDTSAIGASFDGMRLKPVVEWIDGLFSSNA